MLRDIQFSLRILWKDRGYAATVILTLALCIGANTAIFTIVNSVLLRPLPVPESDQILLISNQYPRAGVSEEQMMESGVPDYYDRLRDVTALGEQALYDGANETIDSNGTPQRIRGLEVTPSFFRLVRVAPVEGRVFEESDGEVGNEGKVILSYGLWQQLYGGNAAVGQTLRVSGRPMTVIGVMPRDFVFVDPEVRFWVPLAFTAGQKSENSRLNIDWTNIGRLKPGATIQQVRDQVDALNAANLERFPQFKDILVNAGFYSRVERLQDALVRTIRSTLYLLWGAALLVLLIAAVNLANIALARSNFRSTEVATRLALGAGHLQIARQSIIESLLLATAGGLAGFTLGSWIVRVLTTIGLDRIPRAGEIHVDTMTIGFAAALSLIAGILIGIAPLRHLFRVNLSRVLNQESRSGTGGRVHRMTRRLLVVGQVACAVVLLISSGLLLISFHNLQVLDAGFNPAGVVTAEVAFEAASYARLRDIRLFQDRALPAIRNVPGVVFAGATSSIPLGENQNRSLIYAENYVMSPGESLIAPASSLITSGYFNAIGTPILRGRDFTERDSEDAPKVVIVSQWLANKFWPGTNPLGKRMYLPSDPHDLAKITENTRFFTVVGVVREVQHRDLGETDPVGAYYFPLTQGPYPARNYNFAIKTSTDPALIMRAVRAEIAKLDRGLPLSNVMTMTERVNRSLMSRRAAMVLAMSFAWIAMFLSAIGIYGVLAYLVAQRTREIGIRMALGGTPRGIFNLVLREGMGLVAGGLVLGISLAFAARRFFESQLSGISSNDPVVIGAAVVVIGVTALVACVVPARRATRVDPVAVLNQ
jgi:predicted permease